MPPDQVYYEDRTNKNTLKQLQQLFEYDSFFYDMMFGSRFETLASTLLDDKVIGKNLQYFNKPPLIGKPTPAHQDGYYFMLEPNEAVTLWMALEPVDQENGCVRYVRGSHKLGMRNHGRTQTLGFSQGITDFGPEDDLANEVYFPAQAGDLLVHHALTIHRADGNNSKDRTRKAMGFIYYAARAKENISAHAKYAKKLVDELKQKDKI
jgi:ectoine hydroxylase-related dioxygenase (phytanoyl-CoA dioxygenase family)